MSGSDISSSASKSGSAGKPPDKLWQFFDKVLEENADGQQVAQGSSNRLHRICQCGKQLNSCTVKNGEEHLLNCSKALKAFPNLKSIITQNRADKGDAKNPQATLLKRQYEQSLLGTIPVPKAGEAACINAALLDMLVMCNVAFNVVQSAWFKRFCAVLRPGFKPHVSHAELHCWLLRSAECNAVIGAETYRTTGLGNRHAKITLAVKALLAAVVFPLLCTLSLDGWTNQTVPQYGCSLLSCLALVLSPSRP